MNQSRGRVRRQRCLCRAGRPVTGGDYADLQHLGLGRFRGSRHGRFEATLTGVAARQLVTMIPVESPDASERVFEIEETRAKEDLAEARALFVRETGDRVRTAWRGALAEPLAYLVEQARAADLVVVGRLGPADGDPGLMGAC
jgi:hypothetical protein